MKKSEICSKELGERCSKEQPDREASKSFEVGFFIPNGNFCSDNVVLSSSGTFAIVENAKLMVLDSSINSSYWGTNLEKSSSQYISSCRSYEEPAIGNFSSEQDQGENKYYMEKQCIMKICWNW
ncbi:hypothetical protein MTR_3g007280 [Medicago truncatula]|uniref:Uncharacterized protein n=1 Tax=Medicago truncatula TaxID=3880 RepID=G7J0B0_MEDTR|nr:hypothetical protein MTR_3g007280 [Medicago truncatula]